MWLSAFSLFLILISCTRCTANKIIRNEKDSWTFLNKYGYNPCSNSSKKVLCSVDYSSMLQDFQKRHGLETTGTLDAPTINQMDQPRCGNIDVRAMKLSDFKWSRSSLTWSLRSHPRQIPRARASTIIQEAFNAWIAHIPFQIKETCSTCKSDFVVETGRHDHNCNGGSFDGASGTLAHAFFPQDGRIHFDADEPWTEAFDGSGINFYLVAVHEIGHALGLDHNHNRKSIMYPSYSLFPRGSMLPDYDRQNIQSMYGASKENPPAGECDGSRCGCYKSYCWAYADKDHTNDGDWWCYTQKAGIYGKTEIWQTCAKNSDCFWDRTCGGCLQYKGSEESKQNVCDTDKGNPAVGDCDGSRCGCYKSYCWAYADKDHTNDGDWWCYTQKAGIYGKKEIWQTCAKNSDCFWDRTCGSCIQYKGSDEGSKQNVCNTAKDMKPKFDPNSYYRLTTKWQGDSKSLDILNDGKNNRPILAKTGGYSGQYWKITPVDGTYYRLRTKWQGDGKSLDILLDGNYNRLTLHTTDRYTGQYWKITPIDDTYYRLTTKWQGDGKALDIVDDGKNNIPMLSKPGHYAGQYWKITKV